MIWDAIDFVCREAALQLRRERLIAISTVSTVAVLLVVLGSIALFVMDLRAWTGWMTGQLEVWGFFQSDVPRADATKTLDPIADWPEVQDVKFVTKEEAWQRQKQDFPSIARLEDAIENPLPDAVSIKVREPRHTAAVATKLARVSGIDAVRWGGGLAQQLVKFKRTVNWVALVVSLLVLVAAVFIVHNTIRLALHSRWREIYIMQLVGATRTTVAGPFLLEGTIHGILGAALACCVLVPGHMYLRDLAEHSFFPLAPDRALLFFALYLLLAGALLGLTGSIFSIRRYLRQKPEWHR